MMHFSQSSASSQVSDSRWEGDMSVAINHNNELLRKGGLVARNCVDIASSKMIKNCDEDSTIGVSKVVLWFLYPRPRPIPERDMSRFMEHPAISFHTLSTQFLSCPPCCVQHVDNIGENWIATIGVTQVHF